MTTKRQAETVAPEAPEAPKAPAEVLDPETGANSGPAAAETGADRRARRKERRQRKAAERAAKQEARRSALASEGLSPQQLRNAKRLALRYDVECDDEYDAVEKLRARGIDPFKPANPLALVVDNTNEDGPSGGPAPLPAPRPMMSPAQLRDEERHALEIHAIQMDIAKRRRRNLWALLGRLMLFVMLPVLLVMYYMFEVATPLYAVKSEFMVQNSAPGSAGGALGGVAAVQEAVASQRYLESLDAMVRLNQEEGFIAHFSGENIDPLTRLPADATNEQAFKLYQKKVRLGYDPTEGVVRLEVIAADPETAMRFSKALIGYAEEVTNNLTLRQREDRKRDAETAYSTAYDQLGAAQARVTELQQERGILSAEAEVGAIMSQISTFELELRQEELSLASLQDNPRPNTTLVTVAERRIARLEATIADLRAQLTQGSENSTSLARIKGELLIAEADLTGRQQLFQQALENLTTARQELLQQTGYLTLNVSPILPQEAAYPRRWPNTAMAFLIFAGIYLIASLTASILKEQVSG